MGTLENGAASCVVSESLAESTGTKFTKAGENLLSVIEPVIRNGSRLKLRLKFWFWSRIPMQPPLTLPHSQFQQLLVLPLADGCKVPGFDSSSSHSHSRQDEFWMPLWPLKLSQTQMPFLGVHQPDTFLGSFFCSASYHPLERAQILWELPTHVLSNLHIYQPTASSQPG